MHDVNEGAIPLTLSLLFSKITELKLLSLDELSKMVQMFDYGFLDRSNIPSPIDLEKRSIGQNASQSLCLLRNIPFILYRYRDHSSLYEIWAAVLALLEIVVIVFSSEITEENLSELEEQLTLFSSQIIKWGRRLIPKIHFMLHYPRIIRMIGPIVHMNMLKYERKHQELKKYLTRNFRNLTKSLAEKHQEMLCMNEISFDDEVVEGHKRKLETESNYENVLNIFRSDDIYEIKYLNINNYCYRFGLTFIHEATFYRIQKVFDVKNEYFLLCLPCKIIKFRDFLNSFEIEEIESPDYLLIPLKTIKKRKSYDLMYMESINYIKRMPDMCLNK